MLIILFSCFGLFANPGDGMPFGIPQLEIQPQHSSLARIDHIHFQIEILGFLAETTVTLTVSQKRPAWQEASLLVKLPPQSMVDDFKLGVDQKMVDGVVQAKHLARIAFEAEKRKQVDPGLIEWAGLNFYRIRVFPVSKDHSRTFSFRYLAPLQKNDQSCWYGLDLTKVKSHTKVTLSFSQKDGTSLPRVSGLKKVRFKNVDGNQHFHLAQKGRTNHPIRFEWRPGQRAELMITEGKDDWYFALRSDWQPQAEQVLENPETVAIFGDASLSRLHQPVHQEIDALFDLINFRQPKQLYLIPFREVQETPQQFAPTDAGKKVLRDTLETMIYDGGTQLRNLGMPLPIKADEVWLFSDGYDTSFLPDSFGFRRVPIFAFSALTDAHWPFLAHFSRIHLGSSFHWDKPSVDQLRQVFSTYAIPEYLVKPTLAVSQGSQQLPLLNSHSLLAAGATDRKPRGFRISGKKGFTGSTQSYESSLQELSAQWIKRFQAGLEFHSALNDPEYHYQDLVNLAYDHQMVTPWTSLMVFETPDQYYANGLFPPENAPFEVSKEGHEWYAPKKLPAMRAQYFARVNQQWQTYHRLKSSPDKPTEPSLKPGALQGIPNQADSSNSIHYFERVINPNTSNTRTPYQGETEFITRTAEPGGRSSSASTPSQEEHLHFPANSDKPRIVNQVVQMPEWESVRQVLDHILINDGKTYQRYLASRHAYLDSPAFFYQTAHFLSDHGQPELAHRVISNLLEREWQDDRLLLPTAMLFQHLGDFEAALSLYSELQQRRPEWPQARALVAQAYRQRAYVFEKINQDTAIQYYLTAFGNFEDLILKPWGWVNHIAQYQFLKKKRYPRILHMAIEEALWIQKRLKQLGRDMPLALPDGIEVSSEDITADIKILLWWEDEDMDLDLWIEEPGNLLTSYQKAPNDRGGVILDQVHGLGPDMYRNFKAEPGTYKVNTRYVHSKLSQLIGPTYFKVEIWLNYGREDEIYFTDLHPLENKPQIKLLPLQQISWPPN